LRFPGGGPGEKRLLEAEEIAAACPARFLFALHDPSAEPDEPPWYLVLDRAGESLLTDLRGIDGVQAACVMRGGSYPAVQLDLAPGVLSRIEPEIEAACRRHETLLFEMVQGREAPPDFSGEPRLEPLSASEAARELLHHFKGGPHSALLEDAFGGSATLLYLALTDLTAEMACYRLDVGRLEDTIRAVVTTVKSEAQVMKESAS
jgi:hypothetical protein